MRHSHRLGVTTGAVPATTGEEQDDEQHDHDDGDDPEHLDPQRHPALADVVVGVAVVGVRVVGHGGVLSHLSSSTAETDCIAAVSLYQH